jgi:signal transduction histidine kinase
VRDQSGGAEVEVDADLLCQALLGLVTNAAQAAPEGAVVTLEARRAGDEVALSVLDTGPGVIEADRERIFEPFYSTRKDGHGLGLAVVRQIARAHGAAVWVGDNPGGGACFSILLPAGDPNGLSTASQSRVGEQLACSQQRAEASSAPTQGAEASSAPTGETMPPPGSAIRR